MRCSGSDRSTHIPDDHPRIARDDVGGKYSEKSIRIYYSYTVDGYRWKIEGTEGSYSAPLAVAGMVQASMGDRCRARRPARPEAEVPQPTGE